jgi:hypothetical protein
VRNDLVLAYNDDSGFGTNPARSDVPTVSTTYR